MVKTGRDPPQDGEKKQTETQIFSETRTIIQNQEFSLTSDPTIMKMSSGPPIITLEENGYYLEINTTETKYFFRINDWKNPKRHLITSWKNIDNIGKIQTSRKMKDIRNTLKNFYGEQNYTSKINQIIILIQENTKLWGIQDEISTETQEERTARILQILENKYYFATPDDIEKLYLYQEGFYVSGNTIIKSEVEKLEGSEADTYLCKEIVNHFIRRSYVPRDDFNKYEGEIPVLNGLLDLNTMTLTDFTHEKIFTYKINTNHDQAKECPKFNNFLKEIIEDEKDRKLIQEYAGYSLLPSFPFHKIMILVGSGRNGKGSLIRTITDIIGRKNVSNIPLEYLNGSHRFAVANLYGKLINVCSEPSTQKPFQTELLKKVTRKILS